MLPQVAQQTDLKQVYCIPYSEGGWLETEEKKKRESSVERDRKVKKSNTVSGKTCTELKYFTLICSESKHTVSTLIIRNYHCPNDFIYSVYGS